MRGINQKLVKTSGAYVLLSRKNFRKTSEGGYRSRVYRIEIKVIHSLFQLESTTESKTPVRVNCNCQVHCQSLGPLNRIFVGVIFFNTAAPHIQLPL